jgi:hypothetical protein
MDADFPYTNGCKLRPTDKNEALELAVLSRYVKQTPRPRQTARIPATMGVLKGERLKS